jgi:hypothetical protein
VSDANPLGRITSGVTADEAARKTLEFIERHLPGWRDDPDRPNTERERDLNSQLCKYLNVTAKQDDFAMVHFHHEEPQGVHHSADFSANPLDAGWIEGRQYTKYQPVLVVEGKRLPTPGSGRSREYVTSATGENPMGGIQRFKLGLHGATLSLAGMIGYIQERACADWFAEVNRWIDELASRDDPQWSGTDRLDRFILNSYARVSRCESEHSRMSGNSPRIRLTHLWIEMRLSSQTDAERVNPEKVSGPF